MGQWRELKVLPRFKGGNCVGLCQSMACMGAVLQCSEFMFRIRAPLLPVIFRVCFYRRATPVHGTDHQRTPSCPHLHRKEGGIRRATPRLVLNACMTSPMRRRMTWERSLSTRECWSTCTLRGLESDMVPVIKTHPLLLLLSRMYVYFI